MAAIDDIIAMFGYVPTLAELIKYLNSQPYTSKAKKYLLYQLAEINGETVTKDMIQAVYPHEP